MRNPSGRLLLWTVLFSFVHVGVGSAAAAELPWRPAPQTDPLEFGSLRMETAFARAVSPGELDLALTVTQFNAWDLSWHTNAIHRDQGRRDESVTDADLRTIEQNFPMDTAWHVDVEGWRADLYLSGGIGRATVTLHVPWIEIGSPHWDRLADAFHDALGISAKDRERFRRGDTRVYLKAANNDLIIDRTGLDDSGVGDVSISVGAPVGTVLGARTRLSLALQMPSGEETSLRGSGGWDANLSAFGTWAGERQTVRLAVGYTFLDPAGGFFEAERARHLGHLLLGIERSLSASLVAGAQVRVDASPLARIIDGYVGNPATFYRFSLGRELKEGWVAVTFGNELIPQTGDEADWVIALELGFDL